MEMIKKLKKQEGGFTLVELIVVLVILAILAAILVPTLMGYVTKAQSEKDYATAQTVRVAAQSVVDEKAATTPITAAGTITSATAADLTEVENLAGVTVTSFTFDYDANGAITAGSVTIGSSKYTLASGAWTGSKA